MAAPLTGRAATVAAFLQRLTCLRRPQPSSSPPTPPVTRHVVSDGGDWRLVDARHANQSEYSRQEHTAQNGAPAHKYIMAHSTRKEAEGAVQNGEGVENIGSTESERNVVTWQDVSVAVDRLCFGVASLALGVGTAALVAYLAMASRGQGPGRDMEPGTGCFKEVAVIGA